MRNRSVISRPVLYRTCLVAIVGVSFLVACGVPDPVLPPPPSVDLQAAAQRGHDLVTGLGACGFCHSMDGTTTSALSGGRQIRDKYGEVRGPNITLAKSGIGEWSETALKTALRSSTRPDGSEFSPERHRGFEWLADGDVAAITVYLRSLPAVENEVPTRELSFIDRNTTGFFDSRVEVRGVIPAISPAFKAEYGQYLTDHVARCGSCHSKPGGIFSSEEYMAGGQEISFDGEDKLAPNITSSNSAGIGSWSEQALKDFLRSGRTPSGREVDSRFCPVQFYARAPQAHIDAIVAYLRSVPAIN